MMSGSAGLKDRASATPLTPDLMQHPVLPGITLGYSLDTCPRPSLAITYLPVIFRIASPVPHLVKGPILCATLF
jgi:hypothetical protein